MYVGITPVLRALPVSSRFIRACSAAARELGLGSALAWFRQLQGSAAGPGHGGICRKSSFLQVALCPFVVNLSVLVNLNETFHVQVHVWFVSPDWILTDLYISTYICKYVCMHACICVFMCVQVYVVCVGVHTCICSCVYMCTCMYLNMYAYINMQACVYKYAGMYTFVYMCINIHMFIKCKLINWV